MQPAGAWSFSRSDANKVLPLHQYSDGNVRQRFSSPKYYNVLIGAPSSFHDDDDDDDGR